MTVSAVRDLFERTLGMPARERRALFDAEDVAPALRDEVERLLAAAATADDFAPRVARAATVALAATPPDRIGPYRILDVIGEGGMGTVLLAERDDGTFAQRVAIKLIRGPITEHARERFLRERQLLATFDHPGIARLLDGGTTAGGEPYLVMTYVEGETLAAWAARAKPSLAQRLRLVRALCEAVHYAHQRLVVHCDLKPGNVLVRADGTPVLLDFGIARLVDPGSGNDAATVTRLLTPRYASPEQLLGRPTTTATDVFGLGLVLYELVAGDVPPRGDALRAATLELPPPSRVAAQQPAHRADARRLRGELDKIVRRAVRTEPGARYPSVLALGADLDAHLDGRPVQAAGGHFGYLVGKFLRRHRYAVALGTAAIVALVAFAGQLRVERDRARIAETRATHEADAAKAVTGFLVGVFGELDPEAHPGRQLTARELLDLGRDRIADAAGGRADLRARLQSGLGTIYANAADGPSAIALLEPAVDELARSGTPRERVAALTALARAYNAARRYEPGLAAATKAQALASDALADDPEAIAHAAMARGVAEQSLMRTADAEASFARAQALFERAGARADVASVLHNRGWLAEARGDPAAALAWYDRALAGKRAFLPEDHPKVLNSLHGRGKALTDLGRHVEAAGVFADFLARVERVYGPEAQRTADAYGELASVEQDLGRYDDAQRDYERAIAISWRVAGGAASLDGATEINNYGTLLEERGDVAGAQAQYERSYGWRSRLLPPGHVFASAPAHNLARLLLGAGRADDAAPWLARALERRIANLPPEHPQRLTTELLDVQRRIAGGDREAAAALDALAARIAALTIDAPATLRATLAETRALLALARGDPAAAAREREAVVAITASELPATHPRLAQRRLALAEVLRDAGRSQEAAAIVAEIAPILRANLVATAPARARLDALEHSPAG